MALARTIPPRADAQFEDNRPKILRHRLRVRKRAHAFARTCLERGYIVEGKEWPLNETYKISVQELAIAFAKSHPDLLPHEINHVIRHQRTMIWQEFAGTIASTRQMISLKDDMLALPSLSQWRQSYAAHNTLECLSWVTTPPLLVPQIPKPLSPQKRKTIQFAMEQVGGEVPTTEDAKCRFYYQVIREMGCSIPSEKEMGDEYTTWKGKQYQSALHRDSAAQWFCMLPDDQWKGRDSEVIRKWIATQIGIGDIPDKDWWSLVFETRPTLHMKSDNIFCCDDPYCSNRIRSAALLAI